MNSETSLLKSLRTWIIGIIGGSLALGTTCLLIYVSRVMKPALITSAASDAAREIYQQQTGHLVVAVVAVMALVLVSVLGGLLLISKSRISRPLAGTLDSLSDDSERIAGNASNVARDAGALASVTSKAASGIEEIASTVEELASMTQRNADHSNQTDKLMQETRATVSDADTSMHSLLEAIQAIQRQSAATSKIINTIDEIAFQTNILALNAAIEAARAGEHGASFGVVAEEVRTLARNAAESARNTAVLLEQTNREINNAVAVVDDTSRRFADLNERVLKSSGFVSQIAQASAEQARGIDQLNTSIGKIETVVQQTVANAEHSSAAAQQMIRETSSIENSLLTLRGALGVSRGEGGLAAAITDQKPVLRIAVSTLVSDTVSKWTRQCPLLEVDRFDVPFANRPTVDLILQLQALAAGGLDFDYQLSIHANHGRAVIEVAQGYSDLTAETVWDSEAKASQSLLATSPVIRNGEFEKGLYTLSTHQRLLDATLPDQLSEFVGVTVFNWSVDVEMLESMGLKRIERVSKAENIFQLIRDGRADFALMEFASTPDLSVENAGTKLVPVPNCKVALPGSRSWVISKQSPHAKVLQDAFDHGIAQLRRDGRIERAFGESGFFNPKVARWRSICEGTYRSAAEVARTDAGPLKF